MEKTLRNSILLFLMLITSQGMACTTCNRPLQDAIFNSEFFLNMLIMLAPFSVVLLAVGMVTRAGGGPDTEDEMPRAVSSGNISERYLKVRPLIGPAIVLGVGMGGFVDGIVLHQILQWHQMLSNQVTPDTLFAKNLNMFWDGVFHAFTWLMTLTGIFMLFRVMKKRTVVKSSRVLIGGMLVGWAIFNLTEGLIDHYLLRLHNVRENVATPDLYNHAFTLFSIGLLVAGVLMIRYVNRFPGGKRVNDHAQPQVK